MTFNPADWTVLEQAVVFLGTSVMITGIILAVAIARATRDIRRSMAEQVDAVDILRRGTSEAIWGIANATHDLARAEERQEVVVEIQRGIFG